MLDEVKDTQKPHTKKFSNFLGDWALGIQCQNSQSLLLYYLSPKLVLFKLKTLIEEKTVMVCRALQISALIPPVFIK